MCNSQSTKLQFQEKSRSGYQWTLSSGDVQEIDQCRLIIQIDIDGLQHDQNGWVSSNPYHQRFGKIRQTRTTIYRCIDWPC